MKKFFIIFILLQTMSLNTGFARAELSQPIIRGIYVNPSTFNSPLFPKLLSLVKNSDLNAMVIDIKDDHGHLTFQPPKDSLYFSTSRPYIKNPAALIQTLKENHIYPIARIVVFKDHVLPVSKPNWSFKTSLGIWRNSRGDSFTNPFLMEVWDYNIGIACLAAELGFKEIQFDYVRFPEKFETFENKLIYEKGNFSYLPLNEGQKRVAAVTGFVKYAKMKLTKYPVKMSVDVFGNATVIPEAPGIGQNFSQIAQNVDVISSMIYPSHWNPIFGIQKPDLEPYLLVKEYAKVEKGRLGKLTHPPTSRPWIQDFTATWLGKGNYQIYGKGEIEEQIRALQSQGIHEFLLWNGSSKYTPNVDYTP
ncbi:MAG: putative glycoside hydrolase [Bacillota bacterium]|nr:putative glycoside hydrolase [Bacillota bacterium]